ncbi:MAG TPA: hypothetical protein PKE21_01465 [Flavobacteriales bacterium]|nr:hypothetical protein [Flavobacteriales bacterium]HMR26121.1 hypothetical protein [Flavobacteriales bacterium]
MNFRAAPTPRAIPWLLLIAVALACIALLIDILDGRTSKILGTLGLTLGLAGLAAQRLTGRPIFRAVAVAGFLAFVLMTVHRAGVYQGWW